MPTGVCKIKHKHECRSLAVSLRQYPWGAIFGPGYCFPAAEYKEQKLVHKTGASFWRTRTRPFNFLRLHRVSTEWVWTDVPNSRADVDFLKQRKPSPFEVATTVCLDAEQQLQFIFEQLLDVSNCGTCVKTTHGKPKLPTIRFLTTLNGKSSIEALP